MPYESIEELPESQTREMSQKEKRLLKKLFNEEFYAGADKHEAWEKAHGAVNARAKRLGRKTPKQRRS